jgi:hypothetical protein
MGREGNEQPKLEKTGSFNAAESNQASSFARERIAHAICS